MAKAKKDPVTFILLDESIVTYGFRVLVSGVNLSQIERNPVMFYQHEDYKLPIGRWVNIRKENNQILADAEFDHDDPDVEVKRVIGKVERGFIKMASAGLVEPVFSDEAALKIEGQELPTLVQSRMREASIVNIGSCHNAFRLYDKEGKEIDLSGNINLSDFIRPTTIQNNSMNELAKLLNLADTASNDDITAAVKILLGEKKELSDKLALKEAAEKEALRAAGVTLVDEAIKASRITAESKESWLKLYEVDPEGTKKALGGVPQRQSVTAQIHAAQATSQTELSDFQKKTWDELDRSGDLIKLRDNYPDVYREKFKAKFGTEPQ